MHGPGQHRLARQGLEDALVMDDCGSVPVLLAELEK
jgi:hypothetical protein